MMWWLAQNATGAVALAVVAELLSRSCSLSSSAKHALWLLVILKLMAPPFPLWRWTPWEAATKVPLAANTELGGSSTMAAPVLTALGAIWLAGAVVIASLQVTRLVHFAIARRRGYPAPAWLRAEAANLAAAFGVACPRIALVDGVGSPLLVNALRPVLTIPEGLLGQLDRAAWKGVLTHELAHLKRRDHWVGWLELAGVCVWWWNPVFWRARRRLREYAEHACDAWVVRLLPEGRRRYAESLVAVVDAMNWRSAPAGAIGMASGSGALERRLVMIMQGTSAPRMSGFTVLAVITLALAAAPGWARPVDAANNCAAAAPADPAVSIAGTDVANRFRVAERVEPVALPVAAPVETVAPAPVTTSKPARPEPKHSAVKAPAKKQATSTKAPARVEPPSQVAAPLTPEQPLEQPPAKTSLADAASMEPARVEVSKQPAHTEAKSSGSLQRIEVHGQLKVRANSYSRY